ncbi:ribonucleotide reductase subunit alpha [Marinobacter halodurans]|uniref:Ribonucleotide reductase subunit alpha n=1 Tax=Marinobacter halodurans TaxID=2528979 RepID=A0ABY1ZJY8_9GAMM|nr:ribonucleotide reductase subunit alpha [Marinobacter halodurans]TBW55715.1 ribonucleotide reductase subunit alpha [Marinobacter halodurans]
MIESYRDLIEAADTQPEPQRFLFVFCRAELPEDASAEEQSRFDRGEGGTLSPVICVDKPLQGVRRFEALVEESRATGQEWDVVFVAAMSGRGGQAPTADEAQQPLTMMVETIRLGNVGNYLAFSREGELLAIG